MLKIYGIARTRTSRTLWMAHELGLPYEHIPVAKTDGGTSTPAFLALNPNGRVPAIDDDGVILWESLAINLYLAKRHGGPLAPDGLIEDAQMTMWSVWAMSELEPGASEVLLHTLTLPPDQRDAERLAAALDRVRRPLGALEVSLVSGDGHLVGSRFTVADLNVAAVVFYLRAVADALDGKPATAAWYRAATERPAFRAMMKIRGDS